MADKEKAHPSVEYRGTGFYVSLGVAVLSVIVLLVMALQNTESVSFEFLAWDIELPLFGLIIITALLAVVIDELVGLVWRRRRRQRMTDQKELERLRREYLQTGSPVPAGEEGPEVTDPGAEG